MNGVIGAFGRVLYGLGIAGIVIGALANSSAFCFYMGVIMGIGAGLGWMQN